jgi:hypothetical protein
MTEHELAEQLKYSSPKELLIITRDNKLLLIKCPFRVIIKENVGSLKAGDFDFVTEIKVTRDIITVYIIQNLAYYYYYFEIDI